MMKRLLCLLMVLFLPCAMAEDAGSLPLPPETVTAAPTETPDGLETLDEDTLLDMMAQLPAEGEEDNSAFLVLPEDVEVPDTDTYTLLLIGTDAYTDTQRGRSDTTVLVRLNAADKTIKMVSFLRDMYVKIPGRGSNRINASYVFGGASLLEKTLETNFGVTADAYVEVNFERLVSVIDAIGGVDVTVSEAEREQLNSILRFYNTYTGQKEKDQLLEESGLQTLTGKQALCFSRIRKIDSDFQRSSRQRQVLEAAFHKIAALDVASITALILTNMDAVTTDLTAADAIRLIPLALRCKNASFDAMQVPAEGTYVNTTIDGMAVLRPDLGKNKKRIEAFLGQ